MEIIDARKTNQRSKHSPCIVRLAMAGFQKRQTDGRSYPEPSEQAAYGGVGHTAPGLEAAQSRRCPRATDGWGWGVFQV